MTSRLTRTRTAPPPAATSLIALEGVGGILIIFNSSLGARLLLLYLAGVSVVVLINNFWECSNPACKLEALLFMKNLSLCGSLIMFLSSKTALRNAEAARKLKTV